MTSLDASRLAGTGGSRPDPEPAVLGAPDPEGTEASTGSPADGAAGADRTSRLVALTVAAATAVQLVPRLVGASGGWLFADDFWGQDLVTRVPLSELLLTTAGGHLTPLTTLIGYPFAAWFPFEWWPRVVLAGVLWLVVDGLVLLLMRSLWGWGWATGTAYTVFAVSTLTTPSFLWSGQVVLGATSIIGLTLMLLATVHALRRSGPSRLLVLAGALVVALALNERAALDAVLVGLFGLVAFVPVEGGVLPFLRRHWSVYVTALAVLAGYTALYLWRLGASESDPLLAVRASTADLGKNVMEGLGQSVVPGLLGGPWFLDTTQVIARADVPWWTILVAAEVLLALLVAVVVVRRRGIGAVLLLLVVVGAALVVISIGRAGYGGPMVMRDWRYFASLSLWFPLLIMLALVGVGRPGSDGWPVPLPRPVVASLRRHPVVWGVVGLTLLSGGLITSHLTAQRFQDNPAKPFLQRTLADLDRLGPVVIADRQLPPSVIPSILTTQTLASRVLSAAPVRPQFDVPARALYAIDDSGAVVPADIVTGSVSVPGTDGDCGYAVRSESTRKIRLAGPLFAWRWWVRLDYLAQADSVITVEAGDTTTEVPVAQGPGSVFVPAIGAVDAVFVTAGTDGGVCVAGVRVGEAGPAPGTTSGAG